MPGVELSDQVTADRLNAAIVDTVIDAIVTIDATGTILSFNRSAERIFGYHPSQIIGKPVTALMPESYSDRHQQFVDRYIGGGSAQIIGIGRELEGRRKDGSMFPMYLGVGEARVDGAHLFTGIIRDLTDIKAKERELESAREDLFLQTMFAQRLSALAEMAGGISHELNQPLCSIRMYAETLRVILEREESHQDRAPQMLEKIIHQVERAADVIQHMRQFASAEAQAGTETVNLAHIVDETLDLLGAQLGNHSITLSVNVDPAFVVRRNACRLEQVVTNLVANARDAIGERGEGERSIAISAHQTSSNVCLEIADTGGGIPDEHVDRIYDPFMTTKGPDRGTGLGLAIVHGILRDFGADISLARNGPDGATFVLRFPMKQDIMLA